MISLVGTQITEVANKRLGIISIKEWNSSINWDHSCISYALYEKWTCTIHKTKSLASYFSLKSRNDLDPGQASTKENSPRAQQWQNYLFSAQLLIKTALPSGRNAVLAKQSCPKRMTAYGKADVFPAQKDFPLGSCLLFQVRQTFCPLTTDIFFPLTP